MINRRYELMNRYVSPREVLETRARVERRNGPTDLLDVANDAEWARLNLDSKAPNAYLDYYFSGSDIRCYVAELGDDLDFGDLPLQAVTFQVVQEKQPVYGFQSYTYDAVMRGTRIVQGAFSLVTKHPNYMKNLLAKAAENRSANYRNLSDAYPSPASFRKDDENIETYWGKHVDISAAHQGGSEWSIHPPFSLVIVFGVQNTSLEVPDMNTRYQTFKNDNALLADRNERLVEGFDPNTPTRLILDRCELKSVTRAFSPEAVIVEQYEFFARDIFVPRPGLGSQSSSRRHYGRTGGGVVAK